MRSSSIIAHLVVVLGATMLASCATRVPGSRGPDVPREHLCAFPDPDPIRRLMQWSLGCDGLRQAAPPSAAATLLWYATVGSSSTRADNPLARKCVNASALLPAPGGELYLVSSGLLFRLDRNGALQRVRIESDDRQWRFSHLLGFHRDAAPMKILAIMVSGSGSAKRELPWLFTVQGNVATGEPYMNIDATSDAKLLVKDFVLPRCVDGYDQCLVVNSTEHAAYLGVEQSRGSASRPLQGVDDLDVLDAVWISPRGRTMVLLVRGCIH